MKKHILSLMSLLLFMTAEAQIQEWCGELCSEEVSCCNDAPKFYAKILSGVNFLQNTSIDKNNSSYQTGYIIAGSLGYCWDSGLRLEAEYGFRRNAIRKINFFVEGYSKRGHTQTSSYMANLLWDIPLPFWGCALGKTKPFIGVGLGYDFQQMYACNSRFVFRQNWRHFSWQLMAGVSYPIFCNTELALEYIYHQGSRHFYNHSLGIGVTYKFGLGW